MFELSSIPPRFWTVPYDGSRIPGDGKVPDLERGANCQLFAYALLANFGYEMLRFRSSDLWEDTTCTVVASQPYEAGDLLLCTATPDAWGAHVAVSLGGDQAIHLSRRVGKPAVWSLARFAEEVDYRILIGAKRHRLSGKRREGIDIRHRIVALDHVQLAMPAGGEDLARSFYRGVLGLAEVPKPPNLAARGGVWFASGDLKLHLGVEADFRPARKAHPALLVENLSALLERCAAAGVPAVEDEPLEGYNRAYLSDPFGNRIEVMEPSST